jgi:Tol biopolymer transport system component
MRSSRISTLARGYALFLLLAGGTAGWAAGGQIELVSHVDPGSSSDTASGSGPGHPFFPPAISRDGRYVAFLSVANNLAPGQVDLNANGGQESDDVFLYDRVARTTVLVSHDAASATTGGNGESGPPAISSDGRWVVFPSQATNLADGLPDDFHGQSRLFLYDRVTETLTLVSSSAYLEANGGFGAGAAAISADGRFIAYASDAPDLVPGQQDANQSVDIFLYDRTARTTVLVSRAATPAATAADSASPYLSMSADGRFIAFNRRPLNPAGGLGDGEVLLYDRLAATVTPIAPGGVPTISADGGSLAFLSSGRQVIPGQVDTNGAADDVFLYSRATGRTVLVSHAAGRPTTTGNGASDPPDVFPPLLPLISADGRHIAFFSRATDLVPRQVTPGGALFLYDRTSGVVTLASRKGSSATTSANGIRTATMSADGRFIAFDTLAAGQIPGQVDFNAGPDVFLFDGKSGTTVLVSARGSLRNTGNGPSYSPAISADGTQIAFYSAARDLVARVRDLNNGEDLFLYAVAARTSAVATLHAPGMASASPDADSVLRGLSADGRWVLFEGSAANLVPGQVDTNNQSDVFLYDHATRQTLLVSRSSAATATAATAGDGPSYEGTLSADGRYAVFTSDATNLDPTVSDSTAPGTGQRRLDVFLFDRVTGKTIALSRSARHPGFTGDGDSSRPALSADGRWVAFMSQASDLVPATGTATGNAYLYDRVVGVLTRTNAIVTSVVNPRPLALSADGRYLLTLSRGVGFNVFLYDRVTGTDTLVSHDPSGAPAGVFQGEIPALSADGRFVAFTSGRGDLGGEPGGDVNVYLWDREGGGVTLLGVSSLLVRNFVPRLPTLSTDGGRVAFLSNAETPAPGFDNPGGGDQVVLYDRVAGTTTLVTASALAAGQASEGGAGRPAITPDGRGVDFTSYAEDLLAGVTTEGVFQYDRESGTLALVAPAIASAVLATGGRSVAFQSTASNLVPRDFNGVRDDVFLFSPAP